MNNRSGFAKKTVIIAFVCISFFILAAEIFVYRAGLNKSSLTQHTIAQRSDPRDVRRKSQAVDSMVDDWQEHIRQAAIYCNKHNIWGERRKQITTAQYNAGLAAINKVRDSKFTAPYEPNYPSLPTE